MHPRTGRRGAIRRSYGAVYGAAVHGMVYGCTLELKDDGSVDEEQNSRRSGS